MRITNQYLANSMIKHLQGNLSRLATSQEQIATTKRVNRPSDDPNILSPLLAIKGNLIYNEQYDRNLNDGLAYLDVCDSALGTIGSVLTKAYEYASQTANDSYNPDDRKSVASQIDKLIDQIVELGNSAVGSKYVFAGTDNGHPPFKRVKDDSGVEYIVFMGNTDQVMREVAAHTSYPISANAVGFGATASEGIFGWANDPTPKTITINGVSSDFQVIYMDDPSVSDDFSGVLKELFTFRNSLNDGADPAAQQQKIEESIGGLQKVSDRILQHRVAVGARFNQFEDMKKQILNQNLNLESTMSTLEDADLSKLSILSSQQLLTYQASLAIGSNVLSTSLLDFLR
ncbi:flagellar hook-associated protein FlgL [Desulforamulus aquiferis]|uniref:Flagellar hook-associated protein FlgL n=1 Tax=Desulforamulus aquiferis TaxID=1397668 RepID=A0AAW7ZF56_9FIRM|nr:flagellar hook-associated protein FlgL [Desulforamulus aquiferis]MDO7788342.1 flagellar hook-associated protein FlgL [Desulforamulus aquiferis]RYD06295.1 hypothetical protein N752_05225 [Desulforamulus aquiferis]